MLPTNLTTNEVKDSAGVEVEFLRQKTESRSLVFAASSEAYNAPHRLSISHQEIGAGVNARRRSRVGVSKTLLGVSGKPVTVQAYTVVDIPVGDLDSDDEVENCLAELHSFNALDGTGTTLLFNGSGLGSQSLIKGTL